MFFYGVLNFFSQRFLTFLMDCQVVNKKLHGAGCCIISGHEHQHTVGNDLFAADTCIDVIFGLYVHKNQPYEQNRLAHCFHLHRFNPSLLNQ